jgi:hypothetical protein
VKEELRCGKRCESHEFIQQKHGGLRVVEPGQWHLSGALAGAIFIRIWRAVSDADEAPEPTALDRNIREVLVAGALQGAVFGLVKAAMGRMAAKSYRRFTRNDPAR